MIEIQKSLRSERIPVTDRERRLHGSGMRLRTPLREAMTVVLGRGTRGRSSDVCEIRNEIAPECWGVIGENFLFKDRRWIAVTAPGELFLGLRKLDLLRVCQRLTSPDCSVLLLEEEDVRWLATYFGPRRLLPKLDDLPLKLQQAVEPLFTSASGQIPRSVVDEDDPVGGTTRT